MTTAPEPIAAAVANFAQARDKMLVAWAIYRIDRDDIRKLYRYVRTLRAADRTAQELKSLTD